MPDQTTPSTRLDTPDNAALESAPPGATAAPDDLAIGDTAGTGTVIALGCIGATLFLIVLGLVYIVITQVFG